MKNILSAATILLLTVLISACAGYRDKRHKAALTFPELGSIVQAKGALWDAVAEQVGAPVWQSPIDVTVQQLPFNRASYGEYSDHMLRASKVNGIPYVDSLPFKPKYLRLRLLDKIGMAALLNSPENKNVRSYLENDEAYKIVTVWNVTAEDALMQKILEADRVFLGEDQQHKKRLTLVKGNQKQLVDSSHLEVFSYGLSSFCWGLDKYHKKEIKAIPAGNESCPKATFKKASKALQDKSYLKF